MGSGLVLALGALLEKLKAKGLMLKLNGGEHRTLNIERRTLNWGRWLKAAFLLAAACVMAVGLVKSYSRGAWVGTSIGLAMLVRLKAKGQMLKEGETRIARIGTNAGKSVSIGGIRVWLVVVVLSASVLLFWSLRETQWVPARRAVSVANANDFSWRNRVAAWEGALQMMAEKPWFGYGWNQPERVYDQFYRPSKVPEGAAIQLNDYFTLGTTLGIPALLCFVIYVSLSLRGSPKSKVQSPKPEAQGPAATLAFSLQPLAFQSACRAGAVVLLVGFWFDGGLFKLAMAAPFWILLELGREDTDCTDLHE
jgi:O-antigen ligase